MHEAPADARGEPVWAELRREFPVADRYIYLNHAAVSPLPARAAEAISRCARDFCTQGIVCNREYLELADETRRIAAGLLGTDAGRIAFIKNTTQGLLLAAQGIRWRRGDNVVIPEREFPANVYPWLGLQTRGVETRFVPLMDGRCTARDIEECLDHRTRAVSVSAVSFCSGYRYDLRGIGALCRERGILFVVDGIQAVGALELHVEECLIDVLAADGHKWMLAPQGVGILYVSNEAQERLDVLNLGWRSVENEDDFLGYDMQLKRSAARFEEGTLNLMGIAGLKASLDLITSVGIAAIEARILDIGRQIVEKLEERDYRITSPMGSEERSGIICFAHPQHDTQSVFANLLKQGVVCALRDAAVRVSPHFYNDESDVAGLLRALA